MSSQSTVNPFEAAQLLDQAERVTHMGTWVWDIALNEVRWSSEIYRIFGYTPGDVEPSLEAFFAHVHPDDVERVRAMAASAETSGSSQRYEFRVRHPDGSVRHVSSVSVVMAGDAGKPLRLVGTVLDVTAGRQAAEQLQRSNELLADAQRIAKLGSFEVALRGDQTPRWSDELFRMLDVDPSTPPSIELFVSRLHPDDRDYISGLIEGSLTSGSVRPSRARVVRRDGSTVHIDMRAALHKSEQGEPLSIRGTINDVTELVHLEAQFHQSQKMEAIGQLAGGLAHDYNNLLTIILGNAETLLQELGRPELREIVSAASTATTVTNRLLAFTRQAHGRPRVTDLSREVESAAQLLRRAVGENIALQIEIDDGPHTSLVDHGQVQQMLLNLALNARDAMPRGGKISVRLARAHASQSKAQEHSAKAGEYVQVSVTDTGQGIDEATQQRVFEPFFTTKQPGHGTGLGLAMVFGAMRQCHGFVELRSRLGEGATFELWFPYVARTPEQVVVDDDRGPAQHARILLVEDNAAVARVTAAMLKAGGYAVEVVASAAEALTAWRAKRYDLLVTDVAMPDITGVKLVELLRADFPELRVLFVTGYSSEQLGAELRPDRVSVLNKPFRHAELLSKVRALLA
jgi:two-component system cell cycle sensor histidine kinase/response regulator CckA